MIVLPQGGVDPTRLAALEERVRRLECALALSQGLLQALLPRRGEDATGAHLPALASGESESEAALLMASVNELLREGEQQTAANLVAGSTGMAPELAAALVRDWAQAAPEQLLYWLNGPTVERPWRG